MSVDALLRPRSVAILGASERPSIGRSVMASLDKLGFRGRRLSHQPEIPRAPRPALLSLARRPARGAGRRCLLRQPRARPRQYAARRRAWGARRRRSTTAASPRSGEEGRALQEAVTEHLPRGRDRAVRPELHGRAQPACPQHHLHAGAARPERPRRQCRAHLAKRLDLHRHAGGCAPLRLQPPYLLRQRGGGLGGAITWRR